MGIQPPFISRKTAIWKENYSIYGTGTYDHHGFNHLLTGMILQVSNGYIGAPTALGLMSLYQIIWK